MGTGRPHVEITAATLAGGEKNQDRYAYGDGWAFVLDGASSFARTQPEHDGAWYAERLKQALSAGLKEHAERTTPDIVEGAIRTAAEAHCGEAASCPTSTIALARWNDKTVETYLLGDSLGVLVSPEGEEVLSDNRLAKVAAPIRYEYRARLRAGCGFDTRHRQILRELQRDQAVARNRPDGYWIAGSEPEAAYHGLSYTRPLANIRSVLLATDGAGSGIRYRAFPTWAALHAEDPAETLLRIQQAEETDPAGSRWPRSKPHDDKTLVVVHPSAAAGRSRP